MTRSVKAVVVHSKKVPGLKSIRPVDGGDPRTLFAAFEPGEVVIITPAAISAEPADVIFARQAKELEQHLREIGLTREQLREFVVGARDTWIQRLLRVERGPIRTLRRRLGLQPHPRGGTHHGREYAEQTWRQRWAWVAERWGRPIP